MRNRRHIPGPLAVALLAVAPLTAGVAWPVGAQSSREAVVVIIGATSHTSSLSAAELRDVFRGELVRGADGARLVPFNQPPGSSVRVAFDQRFLDMSPRDAGRYWVDRRIRGQGSPPRSVGSEAMLVRIVARFRGAVAYVRESSLNDDVKALRIDGHSQRDPRHALTIARAAAR